MTQEEVTRITNACDIVCANCERKKYHAFICDECVVAEVSSNAIEQCIEDGCPDENFFDDENTDISNFIDPDYEDYDSSCGV